MEIEDKLLRLYYDFIKKESKFSDLVLIVPKAPQSFSKFPTIVFKEINNTDYIGGKSLNRQEYVDRLGYSVEIYSKDVILNKKKVMSLEVIKELKYLTHKFFNEIGFNRTSSTKGEYVDLTVDRYICTFEGKVNNWNGQII